MNNSPVGKQLERFSARSLSVCLFWLLNIFIKCRDFCWIHGYCGGWLCFPVIKPNKAKNWVQAKKTNVFDTFYKKSALFMHV